MTSKFNEVFDYKASKIEFDKNKISNVIHNELAKFNFEDDYLKEGGLEIISCYQVKFHTCTLENFTDTRSILEASRPNSYGVVVGTKRVSEFNSWDYNLTYNAEFQNSEDNHIINDSHHAIGCDTCRQHGKIRCSSCRGAGELTCSSCSGRGETKCSSCSGRGETKCWSCSGKGSKETGYGDSKRYERCSSCSGRGYSPCSSCRNGYVTCSSCTGRGRVTCYTCHGSGEVTCYHCDGYRTMDHYFIVNSRFINLHQHLFVTNPFHGYDNSKINESNFSIQTKLYELKENRFKDGYFEQLQSHPLFRQICTFFNFKDSEKTKLISSRITFFENKYFEVSFSFYSETYTIFLDQNLAKSYYGGKKPSDQYELDLLNKSLKSLSNNELVAAKKTIQKLSKYDFISINEKYIVAAIDDTQNIYKAINEIDNRNYGYAESTLRLVSDEKKGEEDYKKLIKKLNSVYFLNTLISGSIGLLAIIVILINKNTQFALLNIMIALSLITFCFLINRVARSINFSRWIVVSLLSIQFIYIVYTDIAKENDIRAEYLKVEEFESFKKDKKSLHIEPFNRANEDKNLFYSLTSNTWYSGNMILLENTGVYDKVFVVKGGVEQKWYDYEVYTNQPTGKIKFQSQIREINNLIDALEGSFDMEKEVVVRDWEKGWRYYLKLKDVGVIDRIAVTCIYDDKESFENKRYDTIYLPVYVYDLINNGKAINKLALKDIPSRNLVPNDFKINGPK
jgi:hypothetical protein